MGLKNYATFEFESLKSWGVLKIDEDSSENDWSKKQKVAGVKQLPENSRSVILCNCCKKPSVSQNSD